MNIAGTFIFHNVGQGLFYSGAIQADNNNLFHFVYDCGCIGSKPSRVNAVKFYRRIMGINASRKIHLLILSHLHEDHINGLKELLNGGVQIDTMVIPYFSETSEQLARIDSNSRNRYLQAFYDDPYGLPARRIIIIGAPENERSEGINDNFMIDVNEPSPESRIFTGNSIVMKYRNFWEFRLENMPFPQTEIDSYVHELEQNHGKTLDQLMQDKKFVRDLRRKTKNIFHAPTYRSLINRTSVMMLHKPACQDNYSCGTLLTGDVELHCGDTARILDDAGQNHELLVLQYPHHGGYCGCKCRFLNLRATYNVLSYGCSNKHGHPYQDVIASLPPNETVHVNERCIFSYTIP